MLTPNNIPSKPEPRRVDAEDDDTRQRIPDRPVDQLDDEKKKNKFKDALSKQPGEKKSTEFSLDAKVTVSGSHDTISPFALASGTAASARVGRDELIARADTPKQANSQTSAPQTPRAAPVQLHSTTQTTPQAPTKRPSHYVGTSPPTTPTGTPSQSPRIATTQMPRQDQTPTTQIGAPPTPQATPPAAPKVPSETTPYTAPTGQTQMGPKVAAVDDMGVHLVADVDDGFPEVAISATLPKVEEVVQPLNPNDPNMIIALSTALPKVTAELTTKAVTEPAPIAPTQAARVVAVELAEQMIRKLTTVTAGDRVETKVELRHPPLFEGVTMVLTEFKTATKEFNVAFYNLHNPDARALVESRANQQHLKAELIARGYVLHNVVIEAKVEGTVSLAGDTAMERQRRGEADEDTGDLGGEPRRNLG